ncbi:MAG: hypothetical protein SOV90_03060 [Lachnospiraceae bacterium]|nr:hypothetical protein [Lachnospiraceae bacterium]
MVERYIREYANACRAGIKNYDLMKEEYKEKANRAIDNALKAREKGLITADEAIKIILERFAE